MSSSERIQAELYSKLCLLDELGSVKHMPMRQAFQAYLGMLPKKFHPNITDNICVSQQTFVDSIMNENHGLPVLIVNLDRQQQHLMLFESVGSDAITPSLVTLGNLLKTDSHSPLEKVAGHFDGLMKLLNSPREVAVLHCALYLMYSGTELRSAALRTSVLQFIASMGETETKFREDAEKQYNALISQITSSLENEQKCFEERQMRLHDKEKVMQENRLQNKEKRLSALSKKKHRHIQRIASASMRNWKANLMSQKGKGKGKYKIDRGAEQAIYQALQEQLVAHKSRKGAPVHEGRAHTVELMHVANKWLSDHNKPQVKSKETIRSWAKPRFKRSIQAKQHRG